MTPYYLTPNHHNPLDLESELFFHKKNIYLLALTFDHILICTDNIAAFTRFASADIVVKVINSEWFKKFIEAGIIVLCGWGSDHGTDLMENQIDYALRYRPELKPSSLLSELRRLGNSSDIVVREPAYGEKDHVLFLRDKVRYLEGNLTLDEVSFVSGLVEETQARFGFVGTMELFPIIDDMFLVDNRKADAFYRAYFHSWQEYCSCYYSPAMTVDSHRINLPGRKSMAYHSNKRIMESISSLYSPDFFFAFLSYQLGAKVVVKLLDTRAERLISIRNGDWKVFAERYHDCLISASQFVWVIIEARKLGFLSDEKRLPELVDSIFNLFDQNTDLVSISSLLDMVIKTFLGASFLGPLFSIFKIRINKYLLSWANKTKNREFEPFLRKLHSLLVQRSLNANFLTP